MVVLPPRYSRRLFRSSWLTVISILVSFQLGLYVNTVLTSMVLISSCNYWRNPVFGWSRKFDQVSVGFVFFCQSWMIQWCSSPYHVGYALANCLAFSCYYFARCSENQNHSSLCHCMIHVCANAANLSLYFGISTFNQ